MDDQRIFQELFKQHQGMVKQLCLGYAKGEQAAADDLSQDVFMNVWNALPNFKAKASYKTWIYRITVNTCLMQIRKDKKMPSVEITDQVLKGNPDEKPDSHQGLYQAIGKLSEVDRLLMMLVLEELSYEEIADVIGIKPVNLRVKIHRVREKLKKILSNERVR